MVTIFAIDDTVKAVDSIDPELMGDFVAVTSTDIASAQLIVAQIMLEGQAEKRAFLDQKEKDSSVPDVCDVDEVETGLRREGMYGAVMGFASKISISVTALAGGLMLVASGFDARTAGFFGNISPNVLFKMKYYYIAIQCTGILLAIIVFAFYPISRARAEEVRKILDDRKAATS